MPNIQNLIDQYYKQYWPSCAGCDHWRYHNSLIGDCTKSAPVSGIERIGMTGITKVNVELDAGHVMTNRDHVCGDFIDTYVW